MFKDFQIYPWVLGLLQYKSKDDLLEVLKEAIVDRAEEMHRVLTETKISELKTFTTDDFRKPMSK